MKTRISAETLDAALSEAKRIVDDGWRPSMVEHVREIAMGGDWTRMDAVLDALYEETLAALLRVDTSSRKTALYRDIRQLWSQLKDRFAEDDRQPTADEAKLLGGLEATMGIAGVAVDRIIYGDVQSAMASALETSGGLPILHSMAADWRTSEEIVKSSGIGDAENLLAVLSVLERHRLATIRRSSNGGVMCKLTPLGEGFAVSAAAPA